MQGDKGTADKLTFLIPYISLHYVTQK
uniref:Uncharacterized protein n=1 Tax=Arundo donax TaxID=35708 RepID=A0A0A9FHM6_ARUDO